MKKNPVLIVLFVILMPMLMLFSCTSRISEDLGSERVSVLDNSSYEGLLSVHFLGLHTLGTKNGDASLVITPGDKTLLIDAGNESNHAKLRTYLEKAGIDTLDYVIFSHFHGDHVGDFQKLAADFSIGKVLMLDFPEMEGGSADERAGILEVLYKKAIPYGYLGAGDVLQLDDDIELLCLSPDSPVQYDETVIDDRTRTVFENQYSMVFQLKYREQVFLFTGDIYRDMEYDLVSRYGSQLRSDVLKVPHHGLHTSSSISFLLEVQPSLSVIMSGEPTESTLTSLRNRNRTLTTVAYGTIMVMSDGTTLQVITEHEDTTRGIYSE